MSLNRRCPRCSDLKPKKSFVGLYGRKCKWCRKCRDYYKEAGRRSRLKTGDVTRRDRTRRWLAKDPEGQLRANRRWKIRNPEYQKRWRARNPELAQAIAKRYREKHRKGIREYVRRHRAANPDVYQRYHQADYRKHRTKRLTAMRRWQAANREHYLAYQRQYHRRRRQAASESSA